MKRRKLDAVSLPSDTAKPSPPVSKKGRKSKLNDGVGDEPVRIDKDFEEYQQVMQRQTAKGPSWLNEPQLRPQSPVKKVKEVAAKDDQMGSNTTLSQDALSDLEWMKQRMAKSAVEDSDATIRPPDSQPTNKPDTHQVCLLKLIPLRSMSSNSIVRRPSLLQAIRHATRFSERHGSSSGTSLTPAQWRI